MNIYKKFFGLIIAIVFIFMLFGCTLYEDLSETNTIINFQTKIEQAEEELMSHPAYNLLSTTNVSGAGISETSSENYEIGLDPYYVYRELSRNSFIVFEEDDNYYFSYLEWPYKTSLTYNTQLLNDEQFESLNIPTRDEFTENTEFELSDIQEDNGKFTAVTTVEKLLDDLGIAEEDFTGGQSGSIANRILAAEVSITFSFDNGIKISMVFKYEVFTTSGDKAEITVRMNTSMTPIDEVIDVTNREQFILPRMDV